LDKASSLYCIAFVVVDVIMSSFSQHISAATKLRRIIESPDGYVFAPGVYDGLSARTALEVGFDCLYMVRSSVHLGIESLTLLTANSFL
jgi:2-methylisocitrate lyase-like PEP mutase family enzyme